MHRYHHRDRLTRRRRFGGLKSGITERREHVLADGLAAAPRGSTVLLFVGMPVAISFIAINVIGATLFLGVTRIAPGCAQQRRGAINFSLTRSRFYIDGRSAFHTGLALKSSTRGAADPPGAGPPRRRRVVAERFLRNIGLDHCDDRDARLADAAGDVVARLPSGPGDRPIMAIAQSIC